MANQPTKYKKFVATAATATLVASAIVPVASAATTFPDVPADSEYVPFIDKAVELGLLKGYENGNFGFTDSVKRSQVVIVMGRLLEQAGVTADADYATNKAFSDVSSDETLKYGNIVKKSGVFTGYTDGTLKPNDNINRENMAAVFDRVAKAIAGVSLVDVAKDIEDVTVADLSTALTANQPAIQALRDLGISTSENFNPKGDVQRRHFAKFAVTTVEVVAALVATADQVKEVVEAAEKATTALPAPTAVTKENATDAQTKVGAAQAAIDAAKKAVATSQKLTADEKTAFTNRLATEQAKVDAVKKVIAEVTAPAVDLAVDEVKAINATQIQIVFNKPVSESSVIAGSSAVLPEVEGTLLDGVFTFKALDETSSNEVTANYSKATLSEDGRTLTITAEGNKQFKNRYDVTVDGARDKDGKAVKKYQQVVNFGIDTTAPTILKTEQTSAKVSKVVFSEPILATTPSFTLENGTVVTGVGVDGLGTNELVFNLGNAYAAGNAVAAGSKIIVTFVGVQDKALNLLTPNPATVTVTVGAKDGVKPVVASVVQTGATELEVRFSEALLTVPVITVGNQSTTVKQDATNASLFKVTTNALLDGATTVAVTAGYSDLSGETGDAFSRVYTFVKDIATPKVVSSKVVQDTTNGKQYLEVEFDKNVSLLSTSTITVAGTRVKDYVTNSISKTKPVSYKSSSSKKVVRVALTDLLDKDAVAPTVNDYQLGAVYNLNASFTNVTSETNIAVGTTTANFTLVADGIGSSITAGKVKVLSVAQGADNDTVVVTFDGNVDLATATTISNYIITGAEVVSATTSSATTNQITLKLKANSNTFTGIRNVTVQNVKKLNGTQSMDTQTIVSAELKENVLPTVKSAQLTGVGEITVTFSEALAQIGTVSANDFVLLVGGEAVSTNPITTPTTSTAGTSLKLTLNTALTAQDLAKGIAIKAQSTIDIVDLSGNKVSTPDAIVVTQ